MYTTASSGSKETTITQAGRVNWPLFSLAKQLYPADRCKMDPFTPARAIIEGSHRPIYNHPHILHGSYTL